MGPISIGWGVDADAKKEGLILIRQVCAASRADGISTNEYADPGGFV